MLIKISESDFEQVFDIMEKSFPTDEYRPFSEQKALFLKKEYSVYGLKCDENNSLMGFISLWEFNDFIFIEHFAVKRDLRNKGLGEKILSLLKNISHKPYCLEVELPENDLSVRRINFYKRNGFFLNEYPYIQPAISKGKSPVPLMIMTSGKPVNEDEFLKIKDTLYKRVYHSFF